MALKKAVILSNGRKQGIASPDVLDRVGDMWIAAVKKQHSEVTCFVNSAITASTGLATFNLTTNGTSSGTAIFTTFYAIDCSVLQAVSAAKNAPQVWVNSISSDKKQIIIGVAAAGVFVSGVTVYLSVIGV